jgi:glucose/arabinose dehydrogenase
MKLATAVFLLAATAGAQQIALKEIVRGLDMPVAITHAADTRLFITLQRGRVMIWDGTSLLPAPFLDITPLVRCCGEQGLLSIAFHPHYRDNGFFFVYYVDRNRFVTIARYQAGSDPNRADPASAKVLLQIDHSAHDNHNGGQLQFGPDGFLYIGTGDGGGGGDPDGNSQKLSALFGKMLRIDIDSGSPYAIPPSNPFVGRSDAMPEIWAYGLRNPWRFSFDRATSDLWIADVGQGAWEEVDLQPPTSIGGENYGWNRMEGKHCYPPGSSCNPSLYTLPIVEYGHNAADCSASITGGYRYRGARFSRMAGIYFYGDYCNGGIWGVTQQGNSWTVRSLITTRIAASTFGEDLSGEIYVADYATGVIYQIVDQLPAAPRRRSAHH